MQVIYWRRFHVSGAVIMDHFDVTALAAPHSISRNYKVQSLGCIPQYNRDAFQALRDALV